MTQRLSPCVSPRTADNTLHDRAFALGNLLLDLFLPAACAVCGQALDGGGTRFCDACRGSFRAIVSPLCTRCGTPFETAIADHVCGACRQSKTAFRAVRAGGRYEGALQRSVHRLKFGGDLVQAPCLVALLEHALSALHAHTRRAAAAPGGVFPTPLGLTLDDRPSPDLIVPVPLHPRRLRARGFNQAHVLAEALVRRGAFAPATAFAPRALARVRETPPQARLPRARRRANLRGAFRAVPGAVRGRAVLLVDDVMTTGTTLDACARALMRAGARSVDGLVAARVSVRFESRGA
ncbi:MAG: ComF family protein [Myxococcota bacterium]